MKIKTKLYIGIIFLFTEFLVVGIYSSYSTFQISNHVTAMTNDNILSVQYAEYMLYLIDEMNEARLVSISNTGNTFDYANEKRNIGFFGQELIGEEKNITEKGEKELVVSLREKFNNYKMTTRQTGKNGMAMYMTVQRPLFKGMKSDLFSISSLNMQAILKKNDQVAGAVRSFYIWVSIIASICTLISISFIFNFPNYITGPMKDITDSIKKLAKGNSQKRLNYSSNDEFSEIAAAINTIADRLQILGANKKTEIYKNKKSKH